MRTINATVPELFFVAATRGLAGIGLGLLVSKYFYPDERKRLGLTLLAFGAVTTLPIAARILSQPKPQALLTEQPTPR
jgi:hypothetical protein